MAAAISPSSSSIRRIASILSPAAARAISTSPTGGAIGDVIGAITGGGRSSSDSSSQRIPFLVRGTTSDPRFIADTSGMVIPMLKNQLGNVDVPGLLSGKQRHGGNPFGAIGDLFKKGNLP
jgi:hypothetical protein